MKEVATGHEASCDDACCLGQLGVTESSRDDFVEPHTYSDHTPEGSKGRNDQRENRCHFAELPKVCLGPVPEEDPTPIHGYRSDSRRAQDSHDPQGSLRTATFVHRLHNESG